MVTAEEDEGKFCRAGNFVSSSKIAKMEGRDLPKTEGQTEAASPRAGAAGQARTGATPPVCLPEHDLAVN